MGLVPVTVVANSDHRHHQSVCESVNQTLSYDLTEMRRRSVMLVVHLVFVEGHSLKSAGS